MNLSIEGRVKAYLTKKGCDKKALVREIKQNKIVDAALALIALHVIDKANADAWGYGAIGTGSAEPTNGDTQLQNEVDRQEAVTSRITTSVTNDTIKAISQHVGSGGWSIQEYALVTAASGGTIYCRCTFSSISVGEGDVLEMEYTSQIKRAT